MEKILLNINLIFKQLIFNLRYFYSNLKILLILFIPIIIGSMISVIFVPEANSFSIIMQISLIPTLGIIFASLYFVFFNSTLYEDLQISNNKYNFNISILILMMFFSLLILFILLIILTVFSYFNIIQTNWSKYDYGKYHFNFFNKAIWIPIITSLETSMILFSISFLFTNISSSEKTYYVMIMFFTITSIFFGGDINNYFMPSWYPKDNYHYMLFNPTVFPSWFFIPSLLFPFYPSGQLAFTFGQYSLVHNIAPNFVGLYENWIHLGTLGWSTHSNVPPEYYSNIWRWNIVLVLPLIWILLFGTSGLIVSRVKE